MASFASPSDLSTWLGYSVDETAAQMVLDLVSDEIRADLGWSVSEETGQVQVTNGSKGTAYIFLPTLRLANVTSVVEDGVALVADEDYVWETNGTVTRVSGGYPTSWCEKLLSVSITYDHGYAAPDVPGVFKEVTLDMAVRKLENPAGLRTTLTVGGVSESYSVFNKLIHEVPTAGLSRYRLQDGIA